MFLDKKVRIPQLLSMVAVFSCICFIIVFIFYNISFNMPSAVFISFMLNGIIIIGNLCLLRNQKSSLQLIFWIFNLLFNLIAPIAQLSKSHLPFSTPIYYDDILYTNLMLTMCYFVVMCICYFNPAKRKKAQPKREGKGSWASTELTVTNSFMAVLLLLSTGIFLYHVVNYGIANLLFRSSSVEIYGDNMTEFLIKGTVFPTVMSVSVIFSIIHYRKNKSFGNGLIILYLFLIFVLTFPPTGLARFKFATMYGSIAMVSFKKLRKGVSFTILFLLAMLFLFPLFSVFRNADSGNFIELISNASKTFSSNLVSGDYDSYSSFVSSVDYARQYGASYGFQLLGAVLFFVPRLIWPGKPVGSGAMMAEGLNKNFSNISCQFFAEGYINFGFVGVLLFAILLACIMKKTDQSYWGNARIYATNSPISILYFYAVFLLFFLLRGDLLSTFSFTFGTLITIIALIKVGQYLGRKKEKKQCSSTSPMLR